MNILKQLLDIIKANNEYKRDYRRLQKANLDYNALQNMVNTVSKSGDSVVIEIHTNDGATILIRKEVAKDSQFVSFADRYREAHK